MTVIIAIIMEYSLRNCGLSCLIPWLFLATIPSLCIGQPYIMYYYKLLQLNNRVQAIKASLSTYHLDPVQGCQTPDLVHVHCIPRQHEPGSAVGSSDECIIPWNVSKMRR